MPPTKVEDLDNRDVLSSFTLGTFLYGQSVPRDGFEWRDDLEVMKTPVNEAARNENWGSPWLTAPGFAGWEGEYAPSTRFVGPLTAHREERRGLHRQFAQLEPEQTTIARSAGRYGFLGHGVELEAPGSEERRRRGEAYTFMYGEGLSYWQTEIGQMRSLTDFWDLAEAGAEKALQRYVAWGTVGSTSLLRVTVKIPDWREEETSLLHIMSIFKRGDVLGPAKSIVHPWKHKTPPYAGLLKWAQQDSNLRPADYESAALTN